MTKIAVDTDGTFQNVWVEQCKLCKMTGKPAVFECRGVFMEFMTCAIFMQKEKFVFLVHDISSLKRMEEELKRSKQDLENTVKARTQELEKALHVKSRFLAIMSHGEQN